MVKNRVKRQISSSAMKKYIYGALLVAVVFVMLLAFWNNSYFPSDEEEIFVKGQMIAQGKLLYTDIGTQHMPLMYYLAALFSLLGAGSIISFRVCFYFLQAALWGLMYIRYSDRFGKAAMMLYPCLYIFYMALVDFGYCVLSEQFQGIGMAILLFELLAFYETRRLKQGNMLMISLAVLVSFGSAFVSIFFVFFVGLTVLALETRKCIKKRAGFLGWLAYLIKRYWMLIVIVALPFAVMLIYYAAVGSLKDFYNGAYLINRVVYPKYTGGYGESILSSLFGGVSKYFISLNVSAITTASISLVLLALFSFLFIINMHKKNKDIVLTLGLILLLVASATREGFNHFHGLPATAVSCCMTAIYLSDEYKNVKNNTSGVKRIVIILCIILIGSKYMTGFTRVFNISLSGYNRTDEGAVLDTLTEDNERVGFSTFDYNTLMEARVLPASVYGGACAWMWEWYGDQAMDELTSDPPRVFLYLPGFTNWGYSIDDYAAELKDFVGDHYTSLTSLGYPKIYAKNDYYDEAVSKLDSAFVIAAGDPEHVTQKITGEVTLTQRFQAADDCSVSGISFMTGTYNRENTQALDFYLTDENTGDTIYLNSISCAELADNEYNSLSFAPRQLTAGNYYTITILSPDSTEEDSVSLYYNGSAEYGDDMYMSVNGEIQNGRLCITIREDSVQ